MRIEVQIIRDDYENVMFYATETGHGMGPGNRVDYRELLRKYIVYVGEEEGTDFLSRAKYRNVFTSDELTELNHLAES